MEDVFVANLSLQVLGRLLGLGLEIGGRGGAEEAGEYGLEERAEDDLGAPLVEERY